MPSTNAKRTSGKKAPKHGTAIQLILPARDHRVWQAAIVLAAVVIALYWRVVANGFVNFDDGDYIFLNDHVKGGLTLDGLRWAFKDTSGGNWHPLTWLSHMFDVQMFGLNASAHHLVSAGWHAVNSAVLLVVLWRMTGCLWRSGLVAALFALHPLRVESVVWAAERKDVLSSFFYLCTLGAYAWYTRRPQSWKRYGAVAGLLLLGLMSKPSVVTAPFLLLLLDYWPLRRKERLAVVIREKIPLFALAAAVSVATYLSQKRVGAMTALENLSLTDRLSNAAVSYVRYLGKMVWPHPLAVLYPYQRDLPILVVAASCLLLAAITALALWLGRERRYLPVGWFWFLGTLAPMIGIVQVGWQAYADRYSYISSIGILIALVWAAAGVVTARKWERVAAAPAVAILLALVCTTWTQIPYWHDGMTLFRHAIETTRSNPAAQYHFGSDLADQGRNREAIPHLEEVTRLEPHFYAAYYMLGKSQASEGMTAAAMRSFGAALRLKPDYAEAYYARALMLVKTGDNAAAESDLRSALHFGLSSEWSPDAHNSLGVILAERGDARGAVEQFEEAIRLRPDFAGAQHNLSNARQMLSAERP